MYAVLAIHFVVYALALVEQLVAAVISLQESPYLMALAIAPPFTIIMGHLYHANHATPFVRPALDLLKMNAQPASLFLELCRQEVMGVYVTLTIFITQLQKYAYHAMGYAVPVQVHSKQIA